MKVFAPKKFCFCFPLKKGLLCVGYIRLMICIVTIINFSMSCTALFDLMKDSYEYAVTFLQSVATIIPQLLDLVFTLLLIIAGHKNSPKQMEVYYFYSITMVLVYSLVIILIACDIQRFNLLYYMIFPYSWFLYRSNLYFITVGCLVLVLQTYLALLVRSEVLKLKARCKAEFARQRSCTSFRVPKRIVTNV